jgi:DNA-binding beta-propeller fold protein YncE
MGDQESSRMFHRSQGGSAVSETGRSAGRHRRSGGGGGRVTASLLRVVALTVVVSAAFLAFGAGSALAARGHVFDPGLTIGAPCTEEPCATGKLKEPSGVAVNEATDEVYVSDQGNKRVEVFNGETGAFVRDLESPPGGFGAPEQIAVANSCHLQGLSGSECTTSDPSNEDIYVVDGEAQVVDKFGPEGEFLIQITEAGGTQFSAGNGLKGSGIDPDGKLWVYGEVPLLELDGFSNGMPNEFFKAIRTSGLGFPGRGSGLAVDSAGDFYVRTGADRVAKVGPAGETISPEVDDEPSSAVAVEQTSDTAFVDNLTSVRAFDPAGNELEQLGEEGGGHFLIEGAGIGVDAATGFLYVVDHAAGHVVAFEPELPGAPSVEPGSNFVSGVTSTEATLHAEVNPRSEAGEDPTTYLFEYGPCTTALTCGSSPYGSVTVSGSLAPDFEPHPIAATITGLTPGTTYHYLAVAENSHDPGAPVRGEEGVFATQTSGALVLPDSRQWQLVSPPHKLGARIEAPLRGIQAAAGGGAVTYLTSSPTEAEPAGSPSTVQILSRRGATSWSTADIPIPHTSPTGAPLGEVAEYKLFNPDLTLAAVQPFGQFNPSLSADASESTAFLHDLSGSCGSSCYRPLVTGKSGFANVPAGTSFGEEGECTPGQEAANTPAVACGPRVIGASEDLSHIVLQLRSSGAELTPGAGPHQLYEWSAGSLSQVSLLPDGSPPLGGALNITLGLQSQAARGAISTDGSRIFWSAKASESENLPNLYLRYNATRTQSALAGGECIEAAMGCTIQLDAAEPGCPASECESGGGRFQFASADGFRVFFTDVRPLTEASGAEPEKPDLYECRIVADAVGKRCELTDLTPKAGGESGAVLGGILGGSTDGSYVYFVANGVLTGTSNSRGDHAESGDCKSHNTPPAATCNLYLLHDGLATFIASLTGGDQHDWLEELESQPTRVSSNGRYLALMSESRLTDYDNRAAAGSRPVAEVYLFDAATSRLSCTSCDPSGARPQGVQYERLQTNPIHPGIAVGGGNGWVPSALVAAEVPAWRTMTLGQNRYQFRYLDNSGRLFFTSGEALVPQDSNGTQDVYEYEPPGVGSCTEGSPTFGPRSGGCVNLISSGTSGEESAFLDASENGNDVFFLTASRLVPQDEDAALDVYDAHSCETPEGCLPSLQPPPPACEGDACQQPATPPVDATPGSLTFNGAGNVKECPKGKQLKKGKCVKKKSKKNKGKKHKKKKGHKKGKGKKSDDKKGTPKKDGGR